MIRRCYPSWRCLRIGCPRCDRQRKRDAEIRERQRQAREFVRGIKETVERWRREGDQNLN